MSEGKLVASDGQEVTDAMIEGWCEAYDEGRLPVFRQPLVSQNSIRSFHTSA